MSSMLEQLRNLATVVVGALPCADDVAGLSAAEELEATRLLGGVQQSVGKAISLLASDIERKSARELGTDGLAQGRGFKDGAGLVQDLTGVGRAEAAKLIRVGGLLETAAPVKSGPVAAEPPARDLDELRRASGEWNAPIGAALHNGWLSATQGDALLSGLGAPRGAQFATQWREAALDLIDDCWSGKWSPEDLSRAAKRLRASLDELTAQAEAAQRYRMRSFKRSVRRSGMVHYDVDLDPESDARFYGPIKRLLSPRFGGPRFTAEPAITAATELEADPRSNEQLQADTLVQLVERAVAADDTNLFKTGEPHVMIAVTTTDLAKARSVENTLHRHHEGDHTGCPTAPPAGGVCPGPETGLAWVDGRDEPITATDALRMICEAGFTPALFDETGQAIDLGKDQRYFTRRQRRAITKRDGGCMHPGCDRPPEDCEYHHLNPWAQHPSHHKSEVRDGILLCRRHHKMTHDHGARIRRHDASYWLHWPGKEPQQLHPKSAVRRQLVLQGKIR